MLKSGSEDNKALSYTFLAVLQNFWLRFEATILFKIVSKSNSYATGDDVIPHSPWDKSPILIYHIRVKLLENFERDDNQNENTLCPGWFAKWHNRKYPENN